MSWLRDALIYLGLSGPRRRMGQPTDDPGTAIERYQQDPVITYHGGGFMTPKDVREEVGLREELQEARLRTTKRAADARRIADDALLQSEKTTTEIERQRSERAGVVGDRARDQRLRPILDDTAEQRAQAENARAAADRAKAETERVTAITTAAIEQGAQKKRYIESVGPSDAELAELKTLEERRNELEAWSLSIALNAARGTGVLKLKKPFTDDDGYYAFAGVHYYAGRLAGLSDGDALTSATAALVDRVSRYGPLSEDEAKQNADRYVSTRDAWIRKQNTDTRAQREAEAASAAVEVSRNEVKAAELGLVRVEKLENVIKGKRDGEHFDTKA